MERLQDRRSRSESAGSHHPGKAKLRMTALLIITSDTDTAANMMNIGELSPGRANTLFPMTQNCVFIYVTSKLKGLLHSATRSRVVLQQGPRGRSETPACSETIAYHTIFYKHECRQAEAGRLYRPPHQRLKRSKKEKLRQ